MLYTSAEAAKQLRKWNDELSSLDNLENLSKEFVVSVGEDVESVRPAYDYAGIRDEREALEKKIRALKHAVNVFNASHTVPGTDMTVDQLLIRIPQLSARKARLAAMKNMLPKTREVRYNSNLVEYRYVNYDLAAVAADYEAVSDELAKAQTALDTFNNTERFEFEI